VQHVPFSHGGGGATLGERKGRRRRPRGRRAE
jgi:hypothetical protein